MNTYKTSTGKRLTKSQIDRRIRNSKERFLEEFLEEKGYHYCQNCGETDSYLGCSHIVSVDECQKSGKTEIAWDTNNYELLCHKCHDKHERLAKTEKWGEI